MQQSSRQMGQWFRNPLEACEFFLRVKPVYRPLGDKSKRSGASVPESLLAPSCNAVQPVSAAAARARVNQ